LTRLPSHVIIDFSSVPSFLPTAFVGADDRDTIDMP